VSCLEFIIDPNRSSSRLLIFSCQGMTTSALGSNLRMHDMAHNGSIQTLISHYMDLSR
jgi:hypothetical protein